MIFEKPLVLTPEEAAVSKVSGYVYVAVRTT
jgi:hypothetical protein